MAERLLPIVIGVGAVQGYSGGGLTNPRDAALAGEVPYLPLVDVPSRGIDPVLELRIHGVGGAPPADNLQSPATVQVAGDETAGFYRAWYPGGTAVGRPRREAYSWGGLNTRATSRAFYLLLVAFMLVNVAHWALPNRSIRRAEPANDFARGVLRLLGLALTVAFFGTAVTVLADLVAWQAPRRTGSGSSTGALPSWLGWYAHRGTGPRLGLALLLVLALLGGMMLLSIRTVRAYEERWAGRSCSDDDTKWPLSSPTFWCGGRAVNRQRNLHVVAVSALVVMIAALPASSANGLRVTLLAVAAVSALVAIVLVASPWSDRVRVAGAAPNRSDAVVVWFARTVVTIAALTCLARIWWRPGDSPHALPGNQVLQVSVWFTVFGLVILLSVAIAVQLPWRAGREVMGFGFAGPLLAALGAVIGSIFGSSLILAVANLIGTPQVVVLGAPVRGEALLLPSTVYAGGAGMLVALIALMVVVAYLVGWAFVEGRRLGRTDKSRPADSPPDNTVQSDYAEPGGRDAVRGVAKDWARSELTDHAATVLAVLAIPTTAILVGYLACLQAGLTWSVLQRGASFGGTIGVAATVYFVALLRSALLDATKRKRFGFLWDVGTFWPRACQPFGPPCYAERSIPEVVTRLRRLAGDRVRGPDDWAVAQQDAEQRERSPHDPVEAPSPVVVTGYSQGSPISVAVMAQLPQEVRARTALLTLAAPVRRLYGRAFPTYFGPDVLALLHGYLTDDGVVRWTNLVRRSDYVGGAAFDAGRRPADHALVDREIHDPAVLWRDEDPSPPATHKHSDLFPDPQVRPYAVRLAGLAAGTASSDG